MSDMENRRWRRIDPIEPTTPTTAEGNEEVTVEMLREDEAYRVGYQRGYDKGRKDGEQAARAEAVTELIPAVDERVEREAQAARAEAAAEIARWRDTAEALMDFLSGTLIVWDGGSIDADQANLIVNLRRLLADTPPADDPKRSS